MRTIIGLLILFCSSCVFAENPWKVIDERPIGSNYFDRFDNAPRSAQPDAEKPEVDRERRYAVCLLRHLKGVGSDEAAEAIKEACAVITKRKP